MRSSNQLTIPTFLLTLFFSVVSIIPHSFAFTQKKTTPRPPLNVVGLNQKVLQFSISQLQSMTESTIVEIKHDPAFRRTSRYRAVPFRRLLKGYDLTKDATIEFECMDGYNSVLNADELLTANDINQAYLAYAMEDGSAIPANAQHKDIGPYYLVWPSPKDGLFRESNWPYNLKSFKIINKSFKEQFPGLYPKKLPSDAFAAQQIKEGMEAFRLNCFVCHSMNGSGRATMGIDLKYSPLIDSKTEQELRSFVRNPDTLMPGIKMSTFTLQMLSDKDLSRIIGYLKFMKSEPSEL